MKLQDGDTRYEEHVQCDSGIESLSNDIEQIVKDILTDDWSE